MPHTDAATTGLDDQFRLLVGAITDYAIYSMDPDGIVTSWNTGAQRAKGYSASEVIGQNFSLFFHPRTRLPASPRRLSQPQGRTNGSRTKVGGYARTEHDFGPVSSSMQYWTRAEISSDSPR
jgi:PAS domain S-box-containing protein